METNKVFQGAPRTYKARLYVQSAVKHFQSTTAATAAAAAAGC